MVVVLQCPVAPVASRELRPGDDLDDCTTKFMAAWIRIRSRLTEADMAKLRDMQ
jgi:hypothetical protein